MFKKALIQQFKFAQFTVLKNLERVTHEESLRGPEPEGNCANWVLGHIVQCRGPIHTLLGKEPPMPKERIDRYRRGSDAITGEGGAIDMEELLGAYIASQKELIAGLEAMADEKFAAPKPENWDSPGGDTVGEQLAALVFHESYHAGQLGIIRRALGKGDNLT